MLAEVSVEIPPSISLTYEFAFININKLPIRMNLDERFWEEIFKEKISKRIMDTKTWINNSEIKDLNQDLKSIEVFLLHRDKKQNGDRKVKILINIYLIA